MRNQLFGKRHLAVLNEQYGDADPNTNEQYGDADPNTNEQYGDATTTTTTRLTPYSHPGVFVYNRCGGTPRRAVFTGCVPNCAEHDCHRHVNV